MSINNNDIFEALNDPKRQASAAAAVNNFTRVKMREQGFFERIMPPRELRLRIHLRKLAANEAINPEPKTPRIKELMRLLLRGASPSSAAVLLPFKKLPKATFIAGPRYKVAFDKTVRPRRRLRLKKVGRAA